MIHAIQEEFCACSCLVHSVTCKGREANEQWGMDCQLMGGCSVKVHAEWSWSALWGACWVELVPLMRSWSALWGACCVELVPETLQSLDFSYIPNLINFDKVDWQLLSSAFARWTQHVPFLVTVPLLEESPFKPLVGVVFPPDARA